LACSAHRLDQVVYRACRYALDVSFLHDCSQRLFGKPSGFEEAGEVCAFAQFGDPELDGAGSCLPVAIAVAVALRQAFGILLAVFSAGEAADFELHQSFCCKADHVAQKIRVGGLSYQLVHVHLIRGHR
jgi:hypothetical protein